MQDPDGDEIMDFNGRISIMLLKPFVSNLDNSKKLLTLELSVLIKRRLFADGS